MTQIQFLCLNKSCECKRQLCQECVKSHSSHFSDCVQVNEFQVNVQQKFNMIEKLFKQINTIFEQLIKQFEIFRKKIEENFQNHLDEQINFFNFADIYSKRLDKFIQEHEKQKQPIENIFSQMKINEEIEKQNTNQEINQQQIVWQETKQTQQNQEVQVEFDLEDDVSTIQNNSIQNLLRKTMIQEKKQNWDQAIKFYDQIFQKLKEEIDIFNIIKKRGYAFQNKKQQTQAIQMYEFILQFEKNKDVYYKRGLCYSQINNNQAALQSYEEALQIEPENKSYLQAKCYQLYELKRYQESVNFCNILLKIDPKNVQCMNTKANSLIQLKNYNEAIQCYDEAILINKKYSPSYYNKGIALNQLNQYEDAIKNFEIALQFEPNNFEYSKQKNESIQKLKKNQEEKKKFVDAIQLDPKNPQIYREYGDALFIQKNYQGAIEQYEKALENGYQDQEKLLGIIAKLKK